MNRENHYNLFKQDLHAHHKVLRSKGGSNHHSNLITVCRTCHIGIHRMLNVPMGE